MPNPLMKKREREESEKCVLGRGYKKVCGVRKSYVSLRAPQQQKWGKGWAEKLFMAEGWISSA